jgi:hypothetical protein
MKICSSLLVHYCGLIGDEWNHDDHPTFSCSWCNRDLVRLSDRNNQGELYGSNEYHIAEYVLYRSTVTKLLEDKFGAEPPKHIKKGNVTIFNLDKLRKIQKSYDIDVDIKTTLKNVPKYQGEGQRTEG